MATPLTRELDARALGRSSALEYDPGICSNRAEMLALARVAASHGGRSISHIRSEDRCFWDAVYGIITIGRDAKLPVQISHMKLAMVPHVGLADSLSTVQSGARARGIDITADVYPDANRQSTLTVLYPKRDFTNRAETEHILKEIATPDGLLIGAFAADSTYRGKTVAQIAATAHSHASSSRHSFTVNARSRSKTSCVR
jgi:N-acyl-D-amino-acid deacylase